MGYTKNETPVMRDSRKLCYYTLRVTQNLNNFPKKYRYTLVDRLISSALDIHDNISDANLSWGSERIVYQTEAIKSCRKMDFYLQCVYEVLKPKCSIPHWSAMLENIEKQIVNWRAATKKSLEKK